MDLDCPPLLLARSWANDDDPDLIIVVPDIDALRR